MVSKLQICKYLAGNYYRIEMLVLIRGPWGDVMSDAGVTVQIGWFGEATLIGRITKGSGRGF